MTTKRIFLQLLAYTIEIRDIKTARGDAKDYASNGYGIFFHRESNRKCVIYMSDKHLKPVNFPLLAHEVVHVLQNIANDYDIDFKMEQEFFAYMMTYILNEILGYESY